MKKFKDRDIEFIKEKGCYLTGYAETAIPLTGQDFTPNYFNQYSHLFDNDQTFYSTKASEITCLTNDYWTKAVQGDLSKKINELNNLKTQYVVMAQVPYDLEGHFHWVSGYGGVDENGYVKIVGTSKSDYNPESTRGQIETWNFGDDVSISHLYQSIKNIY